MSTMRIGLPVRVVKSFVGSTPTARQIVARKSLTPTRRSTIVPPRSSVLPIDAAGLESAAREDRRPRLADSVRVRPL